jgi:hypothetical protein
MSRYASRYLVTTTVEKFPCQFETILKECGIQVVHKSKEYLMAREIPGKVPFAKLVLVEALLDHTKARENQVDIDIIVKNDELPLNIDNHCFRLFNLISQAIANAPEWKLLN